MANGEPAIETKDLTRRYGTFTAVDHLNLTVPAGSIFGLLGPNGAGKSTTIKMLTTLLPPSEGSASVVGYDVVREPREVRRNLGYVPQAISAEGVLTGAENLQVFARLYGVPRAVRAQRITDALEMVSLTEFAKTQVRKYSGGMVRRLEMAIALVHRPAILILDEPTIGLDPSARRVIWEQVAKLRSEAQMTILMTTHMMNEAEELCDRVAILHRGHKVAEGTTAELKEPLGPSATLDDVFIAHTGDALEEGGFVDAVSTRRTAKRLG